MRTIIIGAGTNGLYLANILVSRGLDVILLERGDDVFQFFPKNEIRSFGRFNSGIQNGRAIGLGGTTNLWGGQLVKFDSEDLELGPLKWPIEMDVLEYYYEQVFSRLGVKYRREDEVNDHFKLVYTSWLKEPNLKNLVVNTHKLRIYTHVKDVEFIFSENKIIQVIFLSNEEKINISDVENVVFASGTIENIRLLLDLKRNQNCPFRDNENIGSYFQDHLDLTVGKIIKPTSEFLSIISTCVVSGHKFQPKFVIKKSMENQLGCSFIFTLDSDFGHHFNLFKIFIKNILNNNFKGHFNFKSVKLLKSLFYISRHIFPIMYSYFVKNIVYMPKNNVTVRIQMEQLPLKSSCVFYSENGLTLNWELSGNEEKQLLEYIKKFSQYIGDNDLGTFEMNSDINRGVFNFGDTYHHSGGAVMSNSSDVGVVDSNLLVHNTLNLYVVGGAVFPSSSYANTGLTMLALTHRLADFLSNK